MFDPAQVAIPASLHHCLERNWKRILPAVEGIGSYPDGIVKDLPPVLIGSDYLCEQLERQPELLAELWQSGELEKPYLKGQMRRRAERCLNGCDSEAELNRRLRLFRRREMVRIIWRDLSRRADLTETTLSLSEMADALIDLTLDWLHEDAVKRWGRPMGPGADGSPVEQRMVVLGMGKLGAFELNLSSDIDLIFTYPENGETDGSNRTLSNQEFFTRVGKKLIQALDNTTVDGFVFRVDMRLRPFGSVGPLACSFDAMENYYQDQGREWERYAMVKARVVAGDQQAGAELLSLLRPFVYRKYIDFSAFESLREMKALINREVKLKNRDQNVKLGAGGIREVEFIAQAFQLIRGGRDPRLQQRELSAILPLLPECVGMPPEVVDELLESYRFLRDTEHALQALADRQTQELPHDELGQARLAFVMGFGDWAGFSDALTGYRGNVSRHFAEVIAPVQQEQSDREREQQSVDWHRLWDEELESEPSEQFLQSLGFTDPSRALQQLRNLQQLRTVQMLQQVAQVRLQAVLPRLLQAVGRSENPEVTLERVLLLIQAVLRRSAYLVLLAENPGALDQLVRLCSASQWFADQISRQPGLLDELIDPRTLFTPPDKSRLNDELRQLLLRIPEDDTEQLMEALRYYKHAHVLRVAASDITGALPLMKVSDYLTWLAEVILDAVLEIAWRDMTGKYGVPQRVAGEPCDPDFIIVGYGKLGGIELSYGSDLDLVFIYDADANLMTKGGQRELPNPVFFTRLGQRIIHILGTLTPSGQLYEVDMRLRPSGNSGLLVSTLQAFEQYQQNDAWTWEHQALARARVVSGSERLGARFYAVRETILGRERDPEVLKTEVREMREKMRQQLGTSTAKEGQEFNLKQDRGGLVDIEFMVQYLVLAHAHRHPELMRWSDNIRMLESLEQEGLLTPEQAEELREIYKAYRAFNHRRTLQNQPTVVSGDQLSEYRERISAYWAELMES
ncbi:bifunctional [glutamate--ammonia ligase]-adenylyl-L-tyrosine phosphorylase/[glutamate--ammonia-ligase] adenylyltransferase [Marinobacterium sp. D7]|uniref:bifunctional [glutamate--ammonia ligase]-adenylyl-L-tyrosine phosphorylase/[glutamate--ammonia-ligase] adenylyltransferase n=1 Tax=Marinobacterium ramblicola TaxID=2849041 RepID=UPI001C2D872D|nr:bifunctional [glutamate--ammonia ligase]-adenylyl-L-tyrosine phosphorylase/[glutamate--ammonia-ligase] adenylyltransferase [Marinobacterium ramblicola]MBV1788355.1 bifunctional [glutamate--ammonia ligase]-adenylyl-L-tyrosine phosphorylase/[glutamate--ammonia-ligase] adenylyltransferase [Marinobacterium ramblicola]